MCTYMCVHKYRWIIKFIAWIVEIPVSDTREARWNDLTNLKRSQWEYKEYKLLIKEWFWEAKDR